MNPFITLLVALRAVMRNKMRSFLTALGIIIGVAAVIAMMAFGAGAKSQVEQAFAAMGTNLLIVTGGASSTGGSMGGFGSQPTLTWDDLAAIKNEVSTVRAVSPSMGSTQSLVSDQLNWTTRVTGCAPEYFDIRNWPADQGSVFTQQDVDAGAKVTILGATVVEKLFGPTANPVGQSIRIGNTPFTVLGVLSKKGQSPTGQDYDDAAFIPMTTFAHRIQGGLGKYLTGQMYVQASSSDATLRALADVRTLLRDRHHLAPGADDDFQIRNLAEIAGAQAQGTETMTTLLTGVAFVSLVVGGIGIMNIMLVSVTERTREIGVRMAIGAKPRSIMLQFLIEALVLSIAGGLIGVASGVGFGAWYSGRMHWPFQIQVDVIAISVGFSALVGIVFGLYPAWKASQLDPIDALRYE